MQLSQQLHTISENVHLIQNLHGNIGCGYTVTSCIGTKIYRKEINIVSLFHKPYEPSGYILTVPCARTCFAIEDSIFFGRKSYGIQNSLYIGFLEAESILV